MKKKQQKKRNKKYKPLKKYNAGGRVGYAKGDMVQSVEDERNNKFSVDKLENRNVNTASNQQGEPKDPPNGKATIVRNGFIFAWDGYKYVTTGQKADDTIDKDTDTDEETPYVPVQGAVDPNRTARVQATGTSAEAMAKGDFETAGVDIPKIPDAKTLIDPVTGLPAATTELDASSEAFKMQQTTAAQAADVTGVSSEQVSQGQATTAKPTQTKDAAQITQDELATVSDKDVEVKKAEGTVTQGKATVEEGTITAGKESAVIDAAEAALGMADSVDAVISGNAFVAEVKNTGAGVAATPEAERNERSAITGTAADDGTAAEIIGAVGYEVSKGRVVTGTAAKGEAAEMLKVVGNLPPDIAASIVEDPATVEAQVDTNPVEVNAAIAALPTEALVSSQMESLLGGMEDGTIPIWARPAVDAVNQGMAARGISVSTVGRDSLFNAIIQTAMPMAQSNAQALQARAAQNLSNEQQANLQQATQQQQLRLQNLSNRQGAASQTAQMSQQMKTMQSQFRQDAVMTSAQMQQQTRTQNLQNEQQRALTQSQNEQQANMGTLGSQSQLNMAELQIEANVEGANFSAENQRRMVEMQTAADFLAKNAGFKQQMELANLTNEQQIQLANLSSLNQASSENLNADQQTELANLNAQMNTNINNSKLANAMGIAQLNVDQQSAMQNANMVAKMDMAQFTTEQQVVLSNSKFMQTVQIQNMSVEQQSIMQNATAMASMDIANLNVREKLAVENAKNFLTMDMANLNNEQQANMMKAQQEQQRLLSDQSAQNAAAQFNATSENQTNQFMSNLAQNQSQFNASQMNSMEQFNKQALNVAEARRVGNEAEAAKLEAQLKTDVSKFNSQVEAQREEFNTKNETAIAQSNVAWRRQANTADTAAQNAVNQQNAQNAFGLTASAQNFLWQELRDEADFNFRRWDNDETRKTSIYTAALGNDTGAASDSNWSSNLTAISSLINGWMD